MPEPEETNVCGGAHGTCAKCIGWVQIVLNAILTIFCIVLFFLDSVQHRKLEKRLDLPFSLTWALPITLSFIFAPNIVFGVVLLLGSIQKNLKCLRRWTVHTIIFITVIGFCWLMIPLDSKLVVISMGWNFYALWVIRKFSAEIQQIDRDRMDDQTAAAVAAVVTAVP